jgi:septum formation protein
MKRIVLASESPRREEILRSAGLDFTTEASHYEEDLSIEMPPRELAVHLSREKADAVARRHPDAIVIAADTLVVLEGRVLGKPRTAEEAALMLRSLSGKAHSVITGYAVKDSGTGKTRSASVETRVWFRPLLDEEIAGYVKSGEPMDKAGAYAVQGRGGAFVERVEGDFLNVVGLPLNALLETLREFGQAIK